MQRKYPDKLKKELFTAVKSGDAVLLSEVLQQINSSERTSVLDRERYHLLSDEIVKCTPLTLAALNGNLDCVKLLLKYKAEVNRKDESDISNERWTPLGVAATNGHVDVVKFLVANGADVNSCTNYNCTPLMLASQNGHVNVVTILVEYGAKMDLQDSNGDTALHYAVRGNSSDVVHRLLNLGASQLFNNQRLTPLLLACNRCMISVVEDLIKSPECTKEQRIDALELLGASMAVSVENDENDRAFQYMKRGMKERFEDPSNPLFKQPMEPIEAYQNRKESQTLEEVAQIEDDNEAIMMEGFVIRERILGQDNLELLDPIRKLTEELQFAGYYYYYDICIGLCIHAMKIAQRHHQSAVFALECLTNAFRNMVLDHNHPPSQMVLLKVLELTICEYEKERETLSAKIENGE